MQKLTGTVSKIRMIKFDEQPLIRFTLTVGQAQTVNCLIAKHSLNFLADVDEGMRITLYGEPNQRKQFVAKKYRVTGKTKIMIEMENIYSVH